MDARELFQQSPVDAARSLLGWTLEKGGVAGRIVETEAYSEIGDKACHTFFRKTARDFVAKHGAGAIYIYLNYGVYWLLNFMTETPAGERGFVLVRGLEPLDGIDKMRARRGRDKLRELCSGPGKLTIALGIGQDDHEAYVGDGRCSFSLAAPSAPVDENILAGTRIGITKDAHLPWRFGLPSRTGLSKSFPSPDEP